MKRYVQASGFDDWKSVVDEYKDPSTPPTDNDGKKLSQNNSRDKFFIMNCLVDLVYVKVIHCDSPKYI